MKVRFFLLFPLVFLASCAGYHFNTNSNPLIGYDIKSVAVPMFINRSAIPELAAPMTKEVMLVLNDYSGLKVLSGDNEDADAVLIGIIESNDHLDEVMKTSQKLFTDNTGTIKNSVGGRSPFYYPVETSYNLSFRMILIKRPSKEELEMLTSDIGKYMKVNPKVVMMDQFSLSSSYARVVGETVSADSPGSVNFVKNKGILEKSIQETSVRAAQNFKQVVLNAF